MVGAYIRPGDIRHIHYQESEMGLVASVQEQVRALAHELGGRHSVCARGGLFCEHILFPELRNTFVLARKEPSHGRLPLCEQDELRLAQAHHAAVNASGVEYAPRVGLQVVHRETVVGL